MKIDNYFKSGQLLLRAKQAMPGGVNSPVRAFKNIDMDPIVIASAKGARLIDEDKNSYIDYLNGWGPMILGHAFPLVTKAVRVQAKKSLCFGAITELEILLAELIKQMLPNVHLIRMVNSGTEACMSAIRVARGYTHKNKIIKIEGCYHGHADALLAASGSGVAEFSVQSTPGVPSSSTNDTLIVPYNDIPALEAIIKKNQNTIAALIIEPVPGNMGCVLPQPHYLEEIRKICTREKIVLIFDEVMTGFRISSGGAQAYYGVEADIVTLGKIIGGGLPVGAYGGKRAIMEFVAPLGSVYQAGTNSGNPIAMIAGYTTLKYLRDNKNIYQDLEKKTKKLTKELRNIFQRHAVPIQIVEIGSMFTIYFTANNIHNFQDTKTANTSYFKKYFKYCFLNGIYMSPSPFESCFISLPLSQKDIDYTCAVTEAFVSKFPYIAHQND
ncbi:MAG: glutamate-1-semialdehyde 2,1-aminomutase [Phycisphaerales bacterium]|nr:glutamate-1-semialdehyde 2,1-aminomutase [Phycisphaerales bacterium]